MPHRSEALCRFRCSFGSFGVLRHVSDDDVLNIGLGALSLWPKRVGFPELTICTPKRLLKAAYFELQDHKGFRRPGALGPPVDPKPPT